MSLAVLANHMASKGRNGDTMLVHMAPSEVAGLQALGLSHGISMTINPHTGLPEAFSFKKLLKSALPMIAGFALGPAGFGVVSSALGAGALVGGATALATGSLQKGIMAGLGAYGGASLGAGLTAAGSQEAILKANPGLTAGEIAREMGTPGFVQPSMFSKAASGITALGSQAGRDTFMSAVGGGSGLLKAGYAAAAPILADQAVPTATPMPGGTQGQGTIRPYTFNPFTKQWTAQPTYPAMPVRTEAERAPEQQAPGGMATGGIVALAAGGAPDPTQQAQPTAAQLAAQQSIVNDPQAAALAAARSGIAAGMTDQQIADMVNMQYGKSFNAQNVADFMAANNLTRPTPVSGGTTFTPAPLPELPDFAPTTPTLIAPFTPTAPTMSEVRTAYEQGGGATEMPTVTRLGPNERVMTQNAVISDLQGYLANNPNATATEITAWGRANGVPDYQLRAAVNERRFDMMSGGSRNAYDYLMGRGSYPTTPVIPGGGSIMRPYSEVVGGGSAISRFRAPSGGSASGTTGSTGTTNQAALDRLRTTFDRSIFSQSPDAKAAYYNSLLAAGYDDATIRAALNAPLDDSWLALQAIAARLRAGTTGGGVVSGSGVTGGGTSTAGSGSLGAIGGSGSAGSSSPTGTPITDFLFGTQDASKVPVEDRTVTRLPERTVDVSTYDPSEYDYDVGSGERYTEEELAMMDGMRSGGLADVAAAAAARGGNVQQYNLGGYSDGGRLLRGPGDGVSDSIPATIGNRQPARLADGEFVIPARIVSEIGNGSTEAGARKLYAMMDRVQRARAKTTGKGRVAKDTKAEKYLPA